MGSLYGAFAGVFTDHISGFVLEEPLISFESVVQVEVPAYNHEVMLPEILEKFDMPQVYQALAPRPVTILNPVLGDKSPARDPDINLMDQLVSQTYLGLKNQRVWNIANTTTGERNKNILKYFE